MAVPPRVAVVGGGIAGSLCALVLRSRGVQPVIFDAAPRRLGGRLTSRRAERVATEDFEPAAQFLRASSEASPFAQALRLLESNGLVAPWTGRFGVLGSRGGGFLPREIISTSQMGQMTREGSSGSGEAPGDESAGVATTWADGGDFCGFLTGGSKLSELYVGVPSTGSICERLSSLAGFELRRATRVRDLRLEGDRGAWQLELEAQGGSGGGGHEGDFAAVVLAANSPALAAGAVRGLADASASAEGDDALRERLRGLAAALEGIRKQRAPVLSVSLAFPPGSVAPRVPFDAASCPTSRHVQLLVREASKPGRKGDGDAPEYWTAISTSELAADLLKRGGSRTAAASLAEEELPKHISQLLGSYFDYRDGGVPIPLSVSAECWRDAFVTKTMGLKEDCVGLEPWRLAICGDFVSTQGSPIEAAALSGMSAGERVASWLGDAAATTGS
eukprot:TRINITY_DN26906_c0_g1_i1.p1 TRINITY_DN26906_c0_g1~~TRINITY_DN26906_c0_g1_i1.p1  ORF type:complete len:448 (-),score=115.03 TRINITY_DN26906_c0_g1_i1:73-1416(-)